MGASTKPMRMGTVRCLPRVAGMPVQTLAMTFFPRSDSSSYIMAYKYIVFCHGTSQDIKDPVAGRKISQRNKFSKCIKGFALGTHAVFLVSYRCLGECYGGNRSQPKKGNGHGQRRKLLLSQTPNTIIDFFSLLLYFLHKAWC